MRALSETDIKVLRSIADNEKAAHCRVVVFGAPCYGPQEYTLDGDRDDDGKVIPYCRRHALFLGLMGDQDARRLTSDDQISIGVVFAAMAGPEVFPCSPSDLFRYLHPSLVNLDLLQPWLQIGGTLNDGDLEHIEQVTGDRPEFWLRAERLWTLEQAGVL